MNDYDAWIKEVLEESTSPGGDLNAMVRRIYNEAYAHAQETILAAAPKGLPGVTKAQVRAVLESYSPDEIRTGILALRLTQWFNDPDRDAPVKSTMHPDLVWLAQQPDDAFAFLPKLSEERKNATYIYRLGDTVHIRTRPRELFGACFSWAEIEQARRYLARQEVNAVVRERSERTVLSDSLTHLPDYETWFERHGSERTTDAFVVQPATVHELYTMFRARLLDELHQAGVIGGES